MGYKSHYQGKRYENTDIVKATKAKLPIRTGTIPIQQKTTTKKLTTETIKNAPMRTYICKKVIIYTYTLQFSEIYAIK